MKTLEERIKKIVPNGGNWQMVELKKIIYELQQKNDLLQLDFNAAQEIMGCMNKEIEELKKNRDDIAKQLIDAFYREYNRNLKDEKKCQELDKIMDSLEKKDKEIFKALNFIRSSDSSTESAAKAIEMLRKYENTCTHNWENKVIQTRDEFGYLCKPNLVEKCSKCGEWKSFKV
jgi:Rad3-related DNA helicase